MVDVKGLYEEYYDVTEINVTTDLTGYCTYVGDYDGTLVPTSVTVAQLNADPEPWESCFIAVLGLMIVTDNDLGYGEWEAELMDDLGQFIRFDDYWYDPVDVMAAYRGARDPWSLAPAEAVLLTERLPGTTNETHYSFFPGPARTDLKMSLRNNRLVILQENGHPANEWENTPKGYVIDLR